LTVNRLPEAAPTGCAAVVNTGVGVVVGSARKTLSVIT